MASPERVPKKKTELSEEEREKVVQMLLKRFDKARDKLEHGAINETAIQVKVNRATVSRIWKRARGTFSSDSVYKAPSQKSAMCGRKKKDFSRELAKIESVPLNRRSTLQSLAKAIEVPTTTLYHRFKAGFFKRVSSAIKPLLTDENKHRSATWMI